MARRNDFGFTFIEILITISVVVLMSGFVVIGSQAASRGQTLQRTAAALAVEIRTVQNKALSATPESGAVPSGGYGIYFGDSSGTTYQVFSDEDGDHGFDSAELLQQGQLGKNVRFGGFSVGSSSSSAARTSVPQLTMLFCAPYAVTLLYDETTQRGSNCVGDQLTLRRYITLELVPKSGSVSPQAVRFVRIFASGSVELLTNAEASVSVTFPPAAGSFALPPPPPPPPPPPGSTIAKANFQPAGATGTLPIGYVIDSGAVYGNRGNGLTYGWTNAVATFDRNLAVSPDQRYDTVAYMQSSSWDIAVPIAGQYRVRVVAGDALYQPATFDILAEGVSVMVASPSSSSLWVENSVIATVNDGKLTISQGPSAFNNKLNFIEITSLASSVPPPPPPPPPPPGPPPPPPGPPPPPPSGALWVGDFETGNTIQYSFGDSNPGGAGGYQCKVLDGTRGKVVPRSGGYPVRLGNYVSRQHVEPGDNNVAGSGVGERCDIFKSGIGATEGTEMWYAWSTYFPTDFNPTPNTQWNLFADWHNSGCCGQANQNLEINTSVNPPVLENRTYGGCEVCNLRTFVLAPLVRNQWYDFVQHVKWSSDSNVGFLEMWVNGNQVIPFTRMATLYFGQGAYLKLANYRAPGGAASTIYHDEVRAGTTRTSVEIP